MKGEFVMLSKFISSLKQEFGGYNAAALTKDLMAGLTVAAVALPLALAFGVSSGADAASGLITAIIAGLIMSLLSGGYYQISGPTGAMAAILMSLVAAYGMDGVFIATLIAGIILMDVMMPVMDGLTAAREIHATNRVDAAEIPIFAMTANAFYDDVRQSREAGMVEHLSKPIQEQELLDAIRRHVKR